MGTLLIRLFKCLEILVNMIIRLRLYKDISGLNIEKVDAGSTQVHLKIIQAEILSREK